VKTLYIAGVTTFEINDLTEFKEKYLDGMASDENWTLDPPKGVMVIISGE
jgi:hypothetical protein